MCQGKTTPLAEGSHTVPRETYGRGRSQKVPIGIKRNPRPFAVKHNENFKPLVGSAHTVLKKPHTARGSSHTVPRDVQTTHKGTQGDPKSLEGYGAKGTSDRLQRVTIRCQGNPRPLANGSHTVPRRPYTARRAFQNIAKGTQIDGMEHPGEGALDQWYWVPIRCQGNPRPLAENLGEP